MTDRDPTDLGLIPDPDPQPELHPQRHFRRRLPCTHGTPGRRTVDGQPVCPLCWWLENPSGRVVR